MFEIEYAPAVRHRALVVGSGAAGLACACMLHDRGVDAALLTEGMNAGTSRNTGSDKQTYHRLSLLDGDSVDRMTADLFAGGAVDGDNALCEAALSASCFSRLCDLGVPFPCNEYGEYPGYRTDHSETLRATSAGPLTSKFMTERWEDAFCARRIPLYDRMLAVRLAVRDGRVHGLLALDLEKMRYVPFEAGAVVWATGGPAAVYAQNAYPRTQHGATGVPLMAGAAAQSLTEWQYGLASTAPIPWNLSGSYQQVLPRYLCEGGEFLPGTDAEVWEKTFLKGYQWPFDPRKLPGSSDVDLAVYRACAEGKQVFLDFTENPRANAFRFDRLPADARAYLEKSGAVGDTPCARLLQMNPAAYDLYANHGLYLDREPLPIAVCAQHCNGGLSVDAHWRTNLEGLYAIGECAGTHGVYRPGGAALNAGQAGAQRAAEDISAHSPAPSSDPGAFASARKALADFTAALNTASDAALLAFVSDAAGRMSRGCGVFRDPQAVASVRRWLDAQTPAQFAPASPDELPAAFRAWDALVTQRAVAASVDAYISDGGGSRGSYRVAGRPVDLSRLGEVQQTVLTPDGFRSHWRAVRPIPERNLWFEAVWARSRRAAGK